MRLNKLFILAGLTLASSLSFAADIRFSKVGNDQVQAEGSGFTKGSGTWQVNFYVSNDFIDQVNTNPNGSFSYTTPSGKLHDGDKLTVKVLNYNGNGNHYTESYSFNRSGGGGQGGGSTDESIPVAKIQSYAEQQARTVANRVANTYGRVENWKYNFVNGYWNGLGQYSASRSFDESNPEYASGVASGKDAGRISGNQAGTNEGANTGSSYGASDAKSRFAAVVDQKQNPDLTLKIPSYNYQPSVPSLSDDISGDLASEEATFRNEIISITFSEDGFQVAVYDSSNPWGLSSVYRYGGQNKYQFLDSWFRADFALSEWARNGLGGRYDYNLYNKMSYSEKATFEAYFRQAYDSVIDQKFNRVRDQRNDRAFERGQWYGIRAGAKLAYRRGYNSGYGQTYVHAAKSQFGSNFRKYFESSFDSTVAYYQNNAVVELGETMLVDNGQDGAFELGEGLGIRIQRIVNYGRQQAKGLTVSIPAQAGITSTGKQGAFEMAPSSSKSSLVFLGLASISERGESDREIPVQAQIAGVSRSFGFTVKWELIVQKYAQMTDRDAKASALHSYLLKELQAEWLASFKANTNWYSSGLKRDGSKTKLLQLIEVYEQTRSDMIRSMYTEIFKIKDSGGGLHPWLRNHYAKLVNRLR